MASNRPLKLDNWGITWEEYKELTYFCLQYRQKMKQADALLTLPSTTATPAVYYIDGKEYGTFLPHGTKVSDPVATTAERRERLLNDVRMIDQAARAAAGLLAPYLIQAVTTRGGVQAVFANNKPPVGERQFYQMRRQFYWILREMRNGGLGIAQ